MPASGKKRHGLGGTPENAVWRSIVGRCTISSHTSFRHYGGRGITVCDRWLNSFENFLADMGSRPSPIHTVERKDNDGPYSPDNYIWATRRVQSRNYRRNHNVSAFGLIAPIVDWEELSGIKGPTIRRRLKLGWPAERAVTVPPRGVNRHG